MKDKDKPKLITLDTLTEKCQKECDKKVRNSESQFRTLFNTIPDAIVVFDAETKKFIEWNKTALKRYGYSADEIIHMTPHDLHPEEDLEIVEHNINNPDDRKPHIYTHISKDGSKTPVEIQTNPINDYKGCKAWLSVVRDVSARVKDNQASKMEALGALAGGIAHDFNNILTAILGGLDLVEIYCDKNMKSEVVDSLQKVKNAGNKAKDLVDQILNYSRQNNYAPENIDPALIIGQNKALLDIWAKDHDFKYEVNVTKNIYADTTQIFQVIQNLIINARDAVSYGGEIKLSLSDINFDEEYINDYSNIPKGEYVKFSIVDKGIGIDKDSLDKIFDPFYTTKEKGKGTGFGLATVWKIIKNHNGYFDVKSEKGSGTRFDVYLPAVERKQYTKEKEISIISENSKGSILLIDDEKQILNLGKIFLSNFGYEVHTANDGEEGIKKFKEENIDYTITDVTMPKVNGYQVIQQIKEIDPEAMVCVSSGNLSRENESRCIDLGADKILSKPYDYMDLVKVIEEALNPKS